MPGRIFILLISILLIGCTQTGAPHEEKPGACGQWLDNDYAHFFAIRTCNGDTTLFLLNPENRSDTLVRFSTRQPLTLATISTTHVSMFLALNALHALIGVGYADYVVDQEVKQRLSDGKIRTITTSDQLNFETVVDLGPDVLLVYPYGNENYARYNNIGISVLPISEYAEHHPLGRTEWIKVFGLLTGSFSKASSVFEQTATRYHHWQTQASAVSERPVVFTGSYYKGRWAAPAGDSFIARFVEDAGAKYAFENYSGNHNIELDFEVVLRIMADADFFGKVIYRERQITREDFMEDNERFELIRTFSDEQLFFCNTMTTDYFGKGLLEPDLMLRDLYHIFHVDATADADAVDFNYFRPIAR